MTITFDSEAAEQLKIPFDLAVAIVLHDHGVDLSPSVFEELKKIGVLIGDNVSKVVLDRLKGQIQLDSSVEGMFEELIENYPEFDGLRPLRDASDRLKHQYLRKVLANPDLHKTVLNALKREKKARAVRLSRGDFVEAWKSLSKYIQTEGWNRYLHDLPEEKMKTGTGYGEQEL